MSALDNICECCNQYGPYGSVASIPGVPMSIYWCPICIGMQAIPRWIIEEFKLPYTYYDPEYDCYINPDNKRSIIIQMRDGIKFVTRKEAMDYIIGLY